MARNRKGRYHELYILAFIYIYLELSVLVNGKVYPSIQWSFQNPRFKEGTFRLSVLPNSKVGIICPHVATSLATTDELLPNNARYENFWIVDNSSYHQCNVNTSITNNKKLLTCSNPSALHFETLVFLSFSPDRAVAFSPGKTYYFISTSTGFKDSLDSTSKGHCETANMKMQIYICKNAQDVHCSEVKPTTPVIPSFDGIRKKTTTVLTSTVFSKKNTVKLSSTTPQTSPKVTPETTALPKEPPVADQFKKENNEPSSVTASTWIVLVALLVAALVISMIVNIYFCTSFFRKNKSKMHQRPDYNRVDSTVPLKAAANV